MVKQETVALLLLLVCSSAVGGFIPQRNRHSHPPHQQQHQWGRRTTATTRRATTLSSDLRMTTTTTTKTTTKPTTTTMMMRGDGGDDDDSKRGGDDRREFFRKVMTSAALIASGGGGGGGIILGDPASATVFLDPAMYGDQELRVAAVDSLREAVRRAILKNPALSVSFYQLALLDGLSYDPASKQFGPDGSVVRLVLGAKSSPNDDYTASLRECCEVLIEAQKSLKKYTAITIGDAVAIAGAEAVTSIGGPTLPVQLGRTPVDKTAPLPNTVPLDLLNGEQSPDVVTKVFRSAGLTDREMIALLGALLTLERVQKTRSLSDWTKSARPKFREAGKLGRMSEFKRLTDEDIAAMEDEYDEGLSDPDEEFYIADSFGSRDMVFGDKIGGEDINEKNFNKYLKEINAFSEKKAGGGGSSSSAGLGWIANILLDPDNPTALSVLNKYAGSNLSYLKDLGIAYNALTQLGAEFTGGKYENLLKNRPRKTLNDDDLNLF